MARITTRDCEQIVPNRFELVLLAAERAHELWQGAEPLIEETRHAPTVLALREIAAGCLPRKRLRAKLIDRLAGRAAIGAADGEAVAPDQAKEGGQAGEASPAARNRGRDAEDVVSAKEREAALARSAAFMAALEREQQARPRLAS